MNVHNAVTESTQLNTNRQITFAKAGLSYIGLLSRPFGVGSAKQVNTAKYECITRLFFNVHGFVQRNNSN